MASLEDILEASPITSNRNLLDFHVPSRNIIWNNLVEPLNQRGTGRILGRNFKQLTMNSGNEGQTDDNGVSSKQQVLVCHDLKGNYREDRRFSSSKKWDDYRFYHWSGVDYFCYFSHHYVTIPPSGWINAAHRHGVRVLGTFIVEGHNCYLLNEFLGSKVQIKQTVQALVRLCEHFCFEGFLLNIECSVNSQLVSNLHYFVEHLTQTIHTFIPHGTIIWYDSVTSVGTYHHQSELNDRNRSFFELTDGILINYEWTDSRLQNSATLIKEFYPGQEQKVFMGIDVFGRSQTAKFETYKTLRRLIPYGFSVGLFAIGWPFESLKDQYDIETVDGDEFLNEAFLRNNDSFWDLLWEYLPTKTYSKLPFYTNFCMGSGNYFFGYGTRKDEKFFNLTKQAIQPSVPLYGLCRRNFSDGLNCGSCLSIKKPNEIIRLFCTEFHVTKSFIFGFASKTIDNTAELDCVLQVAEIRKPNFKFQIICGKHEKSLVDGNRIIIPAVGKDESYKIAWYLSRAYTALKLPLSLSNYWIVQHYIAEFSEPAIVTDIGVILRAPLEAEGHLGGIYFHAGNFETGGFPIITFNDN